jgi:predicted membrane protein
MAAGIWAIQPRYYRRYTYNVSALGRELEKITKHKIFWLRAAGILFTLGSVALAALIISIIWAA